MIETILIVDDEPNITVSFSSLLKDEGHRPITAASVEQALHEISRKNVALVLLDLNLPDHSGLELLREIKDDPIAPVVLVISGQSEISTALEAIKLGAVDYLEKPVPPEKLISSVRSALMLADANRQRCLMVDDLDTKSKLVGSSKAMKGLLKSIDQIAQAEATVLINGENGTGKELVATRIYLQSQRRNKPFVRVNCPGIPASLFESELFGHTRGAFTGAVKDYPGKFVLADGGTIFLDEIGDLPLDCQAKLLRVLETKEVETLGSIERRLVDVRIICATNRDLQKLVRQGQFREDLFYRVSVLVINVPPLRERLDDVPALVGEFLRRFDPSGATKLSPEAMASLTTSEYPGNVRQLKNVIERLTILHPGTTIGFNTVASELSPILPREPKQAPPALTQKMRRYEEQLIKQALADSGGNISATAEYLGIDRANLSRKIKDLGLKEN